jgi:hypothetical protein
LEPLRTAPWNAAPHGTAHATPHTAAHAASYPTRSAARLVSDQGGSSASPKALTASERVIAAELQARGQSCDALSMMVSSVARMVQAGRCSENRWNAG